MSREASINVYRQLVAIRKDRLEDFEKRKKLIDESIARIEQDLECERQKLAELESEGGR